MPPSFASASKVAQSLPTEPSDRYSVPFFWAGVEKRVRSTSAVGWPRTLRQKVLQPVMICPCSPSPIAIDLAGFPSFVSSRVF